MSAASQRFWLLRSRVRRVAHSQIVSRTRVREDIQSENIQPGRTRFWRGRVKSCVFGQVCSRLVSMLSSCQTFWAD